VIIGESSADVAEDQSIIKPPIGYDSVKGDKGGYDIFVVYNNTRAYPLYLIEFNKLLICLIEWKIWIVISLTFLCSLRVHDRFCFFFPCWESL